MCPGQNPYARERDDEMFVSVVRGRVFLEHCVTRTVLENEYAPGAREQRAGGSRESYVGPSSASGVHPSQRLVSKNSWNPWARPFRIIVSR